MRFNKLTLSAFVSFKDRTVIDLSQFENKLILLFGGSGVGKTAIFDGISFALFGMGSGKDRRSGKVEDYHSDFAKTIAADGSVTHREPMLVELEFEHDDKVYTVTRTVKWGDKGNTKGFTYEMSLTEASGAIIPVTDSKKAPQGTFEGKPSKDGKQADAVSARIVEMLGLNAEQLSQVVILAQGECAKFLNAKATEREEILTKLMENENYVDFETRLKELSNCLDKQIKDLDNKIDNNLNLLQSRSTIDAAEKAQYRASNTTLLSDMEANLKDRQKLVEDLEKTIDQQDQKQKDLSQQKGAMDKQNEVYDGKLQQKASTQKLLDALQAGTNIAHFIKQQGELEQLQQILPQFEAARNAYQELDAHLDAMVVLEDTLKQLKDNKAPLEQAKDNLIAQNTPQIQKLDGELHKLEDAIKVYPVLEAALKKLKQLQQEENKKSQEATTAQNALNTANATITKDQQELTQLGNAQVQETQLLADKTALEGDISALEGLKEDIKDTNEAKEEVGLKRQLEASAKAKNDFCKEDLDKKQQEYFAAERQFQAGSLANKMRELVDKEQLVEVECPVCHTKHKAAQVSQWEDCAVAPVKRALDKAEKAYKEAGKAYSDATAALSGSEGVYRALYTSALAELQKLLGSTLTYEQVEDLTDSSNPLIVKLADKKAKLNKVKTDLKVISPKSVRQQELNQALSQARANLPQLQQKAQTCQTALAEASRKVAEQNSLVATEQGKLTGCPATLKEAQVQQQQLNQKRNALQTAMDKATENFNKCVQNISTTDGQLQEAKKQRDVLVNREMECHEAYDQALGQSGWTEAEFAAAHQANRNKKHELLTSLTVVGAVKAVREKVEDYKEKERNYKTTINNLENELADMKRLDTSDLESQLQAIGEALRVNRLTCEMHNGNIELIKQVADNIRTLLSQRQKKQKVYSQVQPLAEAGKNSVSFNRYVLEDLFYTILDKTNDRLDELCPGQYELKPVLEGKKLKGLEFNVYDCHNNSHRDSGSNSGGEKFEISLALALGLSDIVQSCSKKASRIECLFIDEGFGTLGKEELEKTKRLLLKLSGGNRQIGIISHNPVLEEAIKNQIVVNRDKESREGTKISYKID